MNYRLFEISSYYPKYLEYFYRKNGSLENLDYNEHLRLILDDCFAECNFIHPELQRLGVETKFVIYNDNNLQYKWDSIPNSTPFDIVCRQIKDFSPDVLYISDMGIFSKDELLQLKAICGKNCKFVGWHFSVVSTYGEVLSLFDQIYTGSKYIQTLIQAYCPNTKLLYHAFETALNSKLPQVKQKNEIVFPGSIFIGENIHNNRVDMFTEMFKQHIPCNFYGDLYGSFLPHSLKQIIPWGMRIKECSLERIITEKKLIKNINSSVFGLDYYSVLKKYSICINQHAVIAGTGAGNMRMFEATGIGCCLLTDYRDENSDLFIPDEEIVVYRNYNELIDKCKYLLNNPEAAKKIAMAGQKRTQKDYSYAQKAKRMHEYILELF